ncbi:MAG TPA: hypothetical protein VK971_00560 [Thiohalobacter sp.]|nr:hypothetical protein [Thiohalobacter sp.]
MAQIPIDVKPTPGYRVFAYWILVAGAVLAFITGLVPQPVMGYELRVTVIVVGLVPYIVYGMAFPHLRGTALTVPGAILALIHAAVVLNQRFLNYNGYEDGLIYTVPLVLAVIMAGLVVWALLTRNPMGRPWGPHSRHHQNS